MVLTRKISLTMHEPVWPMLQKLAAEETDGNVNMLIRRITYLELVRKQIMTTSQLMTLFNQVMIDTDQDLDEIV